MIKCYTIIYMVAEASIAKYPPKFQILTWQTFFFHFFNSIFVLYIYILEGSHLHIRSLVRWQHLGLLDLVMINVHVAENLDLVIMLCAQLALGGQDCHYFHLILH